MNPIYSFYMSHDAAMSVYDPQTNDIHSYEFEKNSLITNSKHYSLVQMRTNWLRHGEIVDKAGIRLLEKDFIKAFRYLQRKVKTKKVEKFLIHRTSTNDLKRTLAYYPNIQKILLGHKIEFPNAYEYINNNMDFHHYCHHLSAYLQSPFTKTAIFSFDGFGDIYSRKFAIMDNWKESNVVYYRPSISHVYSRIGFSLENCRSRAYTDIAGKVMGLSAYGEKYGIDKKLYSALDDVLENASMDYNPHSKGDVFKFNVGEYASRYTGRDFSGAGTINDIEYEKQVAYTLQRWFEDKTIKCIENHIDEIKTLGIRNLVLTGGSALNVVTNQKIRDKWKDLNVFVPPNPGDSCQSHGILIQELLKHDIFPKKKNMISCGPPIFENFWENFLSCNDKNKLQFSTTSIKEISNKLRSKKVIGLICGNSELGPRALGNRSIISSTGEGMKDRVNKIKRREWYRPFAPVVQFEKVNLYFSSHRFDNLESMGYALPVKPQAKNMLEAVTHEDGTARVQTIKKKDNPFLWKLLDEYKSPLLNTSFNIQGNAILNSYNDAFWMLINTPLDGVVIVLKNKLYYVEKNRK